MAPSDFIEFVHTPLYKSREFLQQKYVDEGLSLSEIAQLTFSSKDIIRRSLKSQGFVLRTNTKLQRQRLRPRFGFKRVGRKLVPEVAQQATISLIMNLRRKGLSTPQIADILTSTKIVTKQAHLKWHPEMVRRIINQNL
jgi:hypothetical protein